MATFKMGQRVKRVRVICTAVPLYTEGTFLSYDTISITGEQQCSVRWDNGAPVNGWYVSTLAPLTDPKADEFIENIKKLKPYEEPTVAPGAALSQQGSSER